MPNMAVFRPADSKETAAAWYYAVTNGETPISLVLTRQKLPLYEGCPKRALKGGYIIKESKKETPDVILMASGSEVELIYKAADELEVKGIDARVVSIPCFELFDAQDEDYKESVLPNCVRKRVAVEALTSFGWHKYVGLDGEIISLDTFGEIISPSKPTYLCHNKESICMLEASSAFNKIIYLHSLLSLK